MPLVVPGLMSNDKDKTSHWQNQLMGKKLGDASDETVSQPNCFRLAQDTPSFLGALPANTLPSSADLGEERSS